MIIVIYTLFAHYVADFIFQDEKWATTKSENEWSLLKHTLTYTAVMSVFMLLVFGFTWMLFLFSAITFITHTVIDYGTSKWIKSKWEKKQLGSSIPNFGMLSIIGFDQFLHYFFLLMALDVLSLWA